MDERSVLASDAERQAVVGQLQQAHAEGRLTDEEFADRVGRAMTARTRGDLGALHADLPVAVVPVAPAAVPQELGERAPAKQHEEGMAKAWRAWAGVNVLVFAIWAVTSLSSGQLLYPWFLWVAGPWGAVLLMTTIIGGGGRRE